MMDDQNLPLPEGTGNDASLTNPPLTAQLAEGAAGSADNLGVNECVGSHILQSAGELSTPETLATERQETLPSQEQGYEEGEVPPLSSPAEVKAALESLLFATTEPLSVARLTKILGTPTQSEVRTALLELQREYDSCPRGVQIVEVGGGFQMATRPRYAPWIFRLKPSRRRNPLSQATLETLAIIAYKQPITRAEIEAIRGVDSTASIHTLLDLGLIEVGGKREIPGRPQLYITTNLFLKTFGLKSLGDLPSIQELRRMFSGDNKAEPKPQSNSIGHTTAASAVTPVVQPQTAESGNRSHTTSSPEKTSPCEAAETKATPQPPLSTEANVSAPFSHE
ncbi:MAG: SMC-Scp complex subunit ScpB [Candidatus Sumerlaeaceae bacterium]